MLDDVGRGYAQQTLEATMKMLVLAACVLTAGVGTVRAACNSEIEKTKSATRSLTTDRANHVDSGSRLR